ncbi:MAG: hypothetical protein IPG50_32585 [Myxococcales bacterium]|nr:hypothetical protein [Myxococcales bacterium]
MRRGFLLGRDENLAAERHFKKRLLDGLLAAAWEHGPDLNSAEVLCALLGEHAVAEFWLTHNPRPMLESILGVPVPLLGETSARQGR